MKNTIKFDKKSTKVVAHRGLSGIERENTCAAFIAAGNRSYFGIETDIHRTSDGKYVALHDFETGRVSSVNCNINNVTFDEARSIMLYGTDSESEPRADLRIPTLEEYIRICEKYGKESVLELKDAFTTEQLEEIIQIIKGCNHLEKTTFISFVSENMVLLRKTLPKQKAQLLLCDWKDSYLDFLLEHSLDIDIYYGALNESNVKLLKDNGIEINCWTCDDASAAERLAQLGVDYITSNILE